MPIVAQRYGDEAEYPTKVKYMYVAPALLRGKFAGPATDRNMQLPYQIRAQGYLDNMVRG